MSQEIQNYQTFAELFRLMSEFYKYPTAEFYQYVNTKDVQAELKELVEATALNYDIQIHTPFADFDEMKKEYNRINIGAGHIPAPPIESLYKVWTTDETSGMAFASSKGYLMGDSAIHIQYLLEEYGLELPEEFAKKPDHLGVLLELLAFFIDNLEADQVLSSLMTTLTG